MTGMAASAAAAAAASFPVVFFDGEREIDIGNIVVDPSFDFKEFQSILSQKIGIAPHQISVSLICRKKSRSSGTRKIPINEKVNFGSILKEKDCFFVAVLKRSRRERRGKPRQNLEQDELFFSLSPTESFPRNFVPPPEKVLLRREPPGVKPSDFGFVSPFYDQIGSPELGLFDYENQLRNLQIQRDAYLMSTNSYPYTEIKSVYSNSRMITDRVSKGSVICKECASATEKPVPFHSCVYDDTVSEGFRSPAGPIARPSKEKEGNRNWRIQNCIHHRELKKIRICLN